MKQDVGSLRTDPSRRRAAGAFLLHGPTLARILRSIGPHRAGAFLDQLHTDLISGLDALRTATDTTDLGGVQRASHCLIALAGTVGAMELETAARALNLKAQPSTGLVDRDVAAIVARMTARLIAELDSARAGAHYSERPSA